MAKTSNIETVKKMLSGDHASQTKITVGYNPNKPKVHRKVGERWTDSEGKEWIQREGYVEGIGKLDELRKSLHEFRNCPKDECTCYAPNRFDEKYRVWTGMCMDCSIVAETKMRMNGTYEEYEQTKIRANILAWLKDAEAEVQILKAGLEGASFVERDGTVEKWNQTADIEKMKTSIDENFASFKKEILEKIGVDESELK